MTTQTLLVVNLKDKYFSPLIITSTYILVGKTKGQSSLRSLEDDPCAQSGVGVLGISQSLRRRCTFL